MKHRTLITIVSVIIIIAVAAHALYLIALKSLFSTSYSLFVDYSMHVSTNKLLPCRYENVLLCTDYAIKNNISTFYLVATKQNSGSYHLLCVIEPGKIVEGTCYNCFSEIDKVEVVMKCNPYEYPNCHTIYPDYLPNKEAEKIIKWLKSLS